MSPRRTVRIADVDASGRALNVYSATAPVGGPEPDRPYAVYLASRGRYGLLAFDLDAGLGPVGEDLAQLRAWLGVAGIPHLVAASGPGGGRHVWAAIAGGVPAAVVATLARALAARLPTLDIAPLTNPVTGCVRPPGAPHRAGGVSQVLDGDWGVLTGPVATEAAVESLLAVVGPAPARVERGGRPAGTGVDGDGHPHLLGPRRALPAASRAALQEPLAAAADPSAVLWRVLLGAARARWRLGDVAALVATPQSSPGLEHARSARLAPGQPARAPRTTGQREALLARQWAQAVAFVAGSSPDTQDGTDSVYLHRLQTVLQAVTALQARAGASVARWARRGGDADRRVLDHACAVALTGVRAQVDLDIRSVAIAAGIGRETARAALSRLAAEGWLILSAPAEGPRAARWSLPDAPPGAGPGSQAGLPGPGTDPLIKNTKPELSTKNQHVSRSHVVPPPQGSPRPSLPALRSAWLSRLVYRLSGQAHDVFTGAPGGLGHAAGSLYVLLEAGGDAAGGWMSVAQLSTRSGRTVGEVARLLSALAQIRLVLPRVRSGGRTWRARARRYRVGGARQLGVYGVLAARARRVAGEREVWAWWLAELDWMHTKARDRPRAARAGRRGGRGPGPGQERLPLLVALTARQQHGPYPRTPTGRADHAAARAALLLQGEKARAA